MSCEPAKPDDVAALLKRLAAEDKCPLAEIIELLTTGPEGDRDRAAKCRAIAAFTQTLLQDPELQRLAQASVDAHALQTITDLVFPYTTGQYRYFTRAFWDTLRERLNAAQQTEREMYKAAALKIEALRTLQRTLQALGCEDRFDRPAFGAIFPTIDWIKPA